jgi:hypothetical protein
MVAVEVVANAALVVRPEVQTADKRIKRQTFENLLGKSDEMAIFAAHQSRKWTVPIAEQDLK